MTYPPVIPDPWATQKRKDTAAEIVVWTVGAIGAGMLMLAGYVIAHFVIKFW